MNDFKDLTLILKSRFPLVTIQSPEETRVLAILEQAANLLDLALFVWSTTDGLRRVNRRDRVPQTSVFTDALRHISKTPQNGIYVLLDAHPYLEEPAHVRLMKDIAQDYFKTARTLVFVSARIQLPQELQHMTASFELPIPDITTVRKIMSEEAQIWARNNYGNRPKADPEAIELFAKYLTGMLPDDVRRFTRQSLEIDGAITMDDVKRLINFKHNNANTSGLLEFQLDAANVSDIAGLRNLKRWLELRRTAFLKDAKSLGLEEPKGILLLGVQGGGKSLAAKAIAGSWGVPLLRLDFATLYNKFSGETEQNLRTALKTAETMAPCVLWVDEIEKGLATDSSGSSDGGVSRRILGTLLTWMTERKSPVFLTATANDISRLPPELLRKGRFDEIFFIDLPNEEARIEIFRIHLKRRDADPDKFDINELAQVAEGFSGAEIEQAVVSGLYEAHAQQTPLSTQHILSEIQRTKPLSVVMAEQVESLREWAKTRTVMAD